MKAILEWIITNWSVILGVVAVIAVVVIAVIKFMKLPTSVQKQRVKECLKQRVKECLLAWVIEAERDLGGGTGEIKLRIVYGRFVTAFPILKSFISFETFSGWVDEALESMREMLKTNNNLKAVIENDTVVSTEVSK